MLRSDVYFDIRHRTGFAQLDEEQSTKEKYNDMCSSNDACDCLSKLRGNKARSMVLLFVYFLVYF